MNTMKRPLILGLILIFHSVSADEIDTRFLKTGELIFEASFDGEKSPAKPQWYLRKSSWKIEEGVLRGTNDGGNGPFIRLHSQAKEGPLLEDYIMKFSFKVEENPEEKKSNKHHETLSSGHRFSFGHYAAKFQWRSDIGMDLKIGHGAALEDDRFKIKKSQWYHVTAEIRGDEILVWFADGPAYFMKHDHVRTKPDGWEFFTHISETGFIDNLRVWSLADGDHSDWETTKVNIESEGRAFLSEEHPDFQTEKSK